MRDLLNIDSLTDIVSNSVGILIIFAVLSITHELGEQRQVDVPLEHATQRVPAFFIARDDALVYLQPDVVFLNAMARVEQGKADRGEDFDLGYKRLRGEIRDGSDFVIRPTDTLRWHTLAELSSAESPLRLILDHLDADSQYAYFFVHDAGHANGYAMFRKVRAYLKARGIKTGWRPVDEENPAHLCFWDNHLGCGNYAPSYRIDEGAG